jgi:hypothetical protein
LFNKQLKDRIMAAEVVIDALIGVLVGKKLMSRDEIQRQILRSTTKE